MDDPLSLDHLLRERAWVGRLARLLARDEASAADLEQETWLRAMAGASPVRSARAWLGTVIRRLAKDRARAERRRARYERQAGRRPNAHPGPDALVERAETHRRVVSAVLELPPIYRTAVLLHHLEGRSLAEVAERTGAPLETVRTRLRRARTLLRERLERNHGGDRRATTAALLAVAGGGRLAALLTPGALMVGTKTILVASVAFVLILAGGLIALRPGLELPGESPGAGSFPRARRDLSGAAADESLEGRGVRSGPITTLAARVVDPEGHPVPGATVTVRSYGWDNPVDPDVWRRSGLRVRGPVRARATTDAAGRAVIADLPASLWFVGVDASGFARAEVRTQTAPGREPEALVVLDRAHALEGRVLDPDGTAVAGVAVESHPAAAPNDGPRPTGVTDETGRYRLERFPPGTWALRVRVREGLEIAAGVVTIPGVSRYDVRLPEGGILVGRVLDAVAGEPVAGARVGVNVSAAECAGCSHSARALTGEDGAFRIEGLPAGQTNTRVRADGYMTFPEGSREDIFQGNRILAARAVTRLEIRLYPARVIRGRVTGPDGAPVAGAQVRVESGPPGAPPARSKTVRTDAEGRYRIAAARPGDGLIVVRAPGLILPGLPLDPRRLTSARGGPTEFPPALAITVAPEGETVRDVTLALAGTIEGRVALADRRPAAGYRFLLVDDASRRANPTGVSAADGTFRVDGPGVAATLRLCAYGPAGETGWSGPIAYAPGESAGGIAVTVEAGPSIEGVVQDGDGAPVPGAGLRVVSRRLDRPVDAISAFMLRDARRVPVDAEGRFVARGLSAGACSLLVRADGHAPALAVFDDLAPREVRRDVEIVLAASLSIHGRVVDPDGEPVAGAHVLLTPDTRGGGLPARVSASTTTDAAGRFRRDGLARGLHLVLIRAPGSAVGARHVEAGSSEIEFELARGLAIEGKVVDAATGKPLGGIAVQTGVPQPDGSRRSTTTVTAPDGRFRFDDLPDAAYRIKVNGDARRLVGDGGNAYDRGERKDVRAGGDALRIALRRGLAISGRVVDEDGRGLHRADVQATRESSSGRGSAEVWTDAAGRFRLEGLEPGTWTLRADGGLASGGGQFLQSPAVEAEAGTDGLLLVLRRGLRISGRIVDPSGSPIPPGTWLWCDATDEKGRRGTGVPPGGSFNTRLLDPAKVYDLEIECRGRIGRVLGVAPGASDLVIRLQQRSGGEISGRVVDATGAPVPAGVPVSARALDSGEDEEGRRRRTTTAEDGTFLLGGLGDHRFEIRAGGGQSGFERVLAPEPWEPGATGIVLRVRRLPRFSGRLVDGQGNPVLFDEIRLERPRDGLKIAWRQGHSGRGDFDFQRVPVGRVRVVVLVGDERIDVGEVDLPAENVVLRVPGR